MGKPKKNTPRYVLSEQTGTLIAQLDVLQEWQCENDAFFAEHYDTTKDERVKAVIDAFEVLEDAFERLIGKSVSFQLGQGGFNDDFSQVV